MPKKINDLISLDKPLVIFDLETTGLSVNLDRIIEIAYLKIMPACAGGTDGEILKGDLLLNPEMNIPAEALAIHGISDEKVKEWENLFKITLDICVKNIGSLFPRTSDSKVFNRAVFESVMAAVARLKAKNTLNQRTLKAKYENLVQIDSYKMSVASQTSDTKKYKERIKYAIETLS